MPVLCWPVRAKITHNTLHLHHRRFWILLNGMYVHALRVLVSTKVFKCILILLFAYRQTRHTGTLLVPGILLYMYGTAVFSSILARPNYIVRPIK